MLVIATSLFMLVVTIYLFFAWNFDYWKRRGVVGPTPHIFVGNFPKMSFRDKKCSFIQETMNIYDKYFREHRFIGVFLFRTPKLMILDPELASEIYTKYFRNFGDNSLSAFIDERVDPLFKPNPFIEPIEHWKERRMEIVPALTWSKVKAMYAAIENACHQLEQYINRKIESGSPVIASKDICVRVTADVSCNVIFGLDAKAFDEKSDYLEHSLRMFNSTPYDHIRLVLYSIFPWLWKVYPNQFTSTEFTKWFKDTCDQAIRLRKECHISRDDYLNFLIELQNKKNMSTDSIHARAFTFFLNTFETSSYMIGNAVNFLAENTECQEKLRAEIKAHNNITFEELHRLPYLDAVVNESTRLSISPFSIHKICTESVNLTDFDGRSVNVEKGIEIILPIESLHRRGDFYKDPEKFTPERFLESSVTIKSLTNAGIYQPFGNGPRQCPDLICEEIACIFTCLVGLRVGIAQIKTVLYTLVRKFEFSLNSTKKMPILPNGLFSFNHNYAELRMKRLT